MSTFSNEYDYMDIYFTEWTETLTFTNIITYKIIELCFLYIYI